MKTPTLQLLLAAACSIAVGAFVAPKPSLSRLNPALGAFSPDQIDLAAIHQSYDHLHHAVSSSTSLLADAAAVVADDATAAAVDAADKPDFWTSYYNIFKTILSGVHSAIDEPLRGVGITQTWGVSIFLFTAMIRTLLVPLSVQQTKSAEYIKALKPYITEINEKFKNNENAKNRAVGKLYEDANQNPFAGCLLSLAQLPVLLGLYRGIRGLAMDGALEERFLWIPSLEGPVTAETDFRGMDWLVKGWTSVDGFPTPQLGWETTLAFLVMPVILVLGQSVSMQLLSPEQDTENMSAEEKDQLEKSQAVLKFLPLLIGFFSLQVPAGLTIYWFTSNLYSVTQSQIIKAYYKANPPEIELPDYWDALDNMEEMTPEEKRKAAEAGISSGPSFEQLLEEANFHYVVQRSPLRPESEAWKRIEASETRAIPPEFQEWVAKANQSPKQEPANVTA